MDSAVGQPAGPHGGRVGCPVRGSRNVRPRGTPATAPGSSSTVVTSARCRASPSQTIPHDVNTVGRRSEDDSGAVQASLHNARLVEYAKVFGDILLGGPERARRARRHRARRPAGDRVDGSLISFQCRTTRAPVPSLDGIRRLQRSAGFGTLSGGASALGAVSSSAPRENRYGRRLRPRRRIGRGRPSPSYEE